jgi:hypothetical protein
MRFRPFITLLACFTGAAGALGAAQPALQAIKTIPLCDVAGRIDHMAIDSQKGLLLVAALGNNSVEAIDVNRGVVVARAKQIREPQGIRITKSHKVIVASGGDGMVRAFDENLHELAHIDGLVDADNVRYDAPRDLVYVGYGESKAGLAIIDPEKMIKTGEIALPSHPESFQISPDGKRIFANLPAEKQVMVIDTSKRKVIDHWALPVAANFPMALDSSRHRLLVASRDPAKLLLFDIDSGKLTQTIETAGDADDVWTDEPAGCAFVTAGEGFVDVYQWQPDSALKLIEKVPTAPGARTSLFVAPTRRLYVAAPKRGQRNAEVRVFESSNP